MIQTITLENKITVLLEKLNFLKSISLGIWVKNGSRNEEFKNMGISHFIEHMIFKGTSKRTSKDIARDIDSLGGHFNAFTSKEYTCYYFKILNTNFDKALELISDMFLNSTFKEEEIEKESKVIIEEINMYEDTPEEFANDLLQYNVWKKNSLGFPILGSKKSVSSFIKKDFINHYKKNYTSDNIIISVCGNYDNNILKKIENYFGKLKNLSKNDEYIKPIYKKCIVEQNKSIEQINFILGFESIKMDINKNYIMYLFNNIFGGGVSSRLFQKIREDKGLAYSVYSYNYSYRDTGLFSIYAGVSKNNLELSLYSIINEIKNLKYNKITKEELEITKEQLKTSYLLSLENSSSRMNFMAKSQIIFNKIINQDDIITIIDNIKLEDIYSLIEEIFDLEKISLCVIGNIKNINLKEVLDNAR